MPPSRCASAPPGQRHEIRDTTPQSYLPSRHLRRTSSGSVVKKAEGASDSLVVGGKYGELEALPATIARLASEHGDEGVVVVLDENLELYGHPRIKGSEMCKQLRDVHNFGGVVVIYSANDEDESKEMAVAAGADGLIGKGVGKGLQMLHDTIAKWYERRFGDDSFKQ